MEFDKHLQKQIKEHLTIDFIKDPSFMKFIQSVNESYLAFENENFIKDNNLKLLEQTLELKRLLINSSLNSIITVDKDKQITFWNQRAETDFGWAKEEIIGNKIIDIIIPFRYRKLWNILTTKYQKEGENTYINKQQEIILINKAGNEFYGEISIIPIYQFGKEYFNVFIQDITKRKEAEKIHKIQDKKYQNIITNMNLGLLEVDNNQNIQYANQSFADMSGYEIEELLGKNPSEIFVFGDNLNSVNSKDNIREKGSDFYQISIKNKKGQLKWWAISGAPNYDNKGNLTGSIGIHLDITKQKLLETALEIEKSNAIESSKAKEVFLANMSHEIRTPLNAIIGFLRELDKQELTKIQKKYINNSTIASKHLLAIINNILDISKIEAGEMTLENEDFIFVNSITNVTSVLQPMLEKKGLAFNVSISNEIEKILKGDTLRIQQILFNLVGNAIKFTNKGHISINCEVVNKKPFSQEIQISVSDTGIGMESNFINTIFNKFSQEDVAITRKYGGTGLGLTITKELVKLMNGRIVIESKKNEGTIIRLYIHFQKGNIQNSGNLNIENIPTRIDNISILLVEDNYLNRMIAQNTLHYYNCKITEAENGVEAIEILKTEKFDIILMDVQMPQMGGIEATEIIRNELHILTPIIAFTANAFKTEIVKCKQAGMNDYVTKPFDEDVLIETIAKHTLNKKPLLPVSTMKEITTNEILYNIASLQKLSRGNDEFVTKMINIFVNQTTDIIEKTAIAISQNNFIEASRLIHKIKPSIESLGITTLIKKIKLLEKITKETSDKEQILALFNTIQNILQKVILQLKENELTI
jgi:PAS domain S-box-containing protein